MIARTQAFAGRTGRLLPGAALAGVIALAATFVSQLHGGPQFLYALFFGTAFHYLSQEARTQPGIEFCAKAVLRLGVGLLGARITAEQIAQLGWTTAAIVVAAVASTIALGTLAGRRFGLTRAQGVLSGGSVAICGASAALAISAVLPRDKHHERFTLMVVVSVTILSTAAMVIYPLICRALGLPPALAGLFLGGTIHDVAQVVGAGYTLGPATGDIATVVKLFRVALLVVVVVVLSAAFKHQREVQREAQAAETGTTHLGKPPPLVPWFLWVFVGLVALNSLGVVPAGVQSGLGQFSRGCLVVAIAALGAKTHFMQLAKAGWGPVLLIVAETLWMAALVLAAILMMR